MLWVSSIFMAHKLYYVFINGMSQLFSLCHMSWTACHDCFVSGTTVELHIIIVWLMVQLRKSRAASLEWWWFWWFVVCLLSLWGRSSTLFWNCNCLSTTEKVFCWYLQQLWIENVTLYCFCWMTSVTLDRLFQSITVNFKHPKGAAIVQQVCLILLNC